MSGSTRLAEQGAVLARVGLKFGVPVAVAFGSLYVVVRVLGIPFSSLSRDPAATYSYPWYGGAVSHVGVLVAIATSVVLVLTSELARRTGRRPMAGFTRWLGVGLVVFALDDLLMLHEVVLPALGIPDLMAVAIYPLGAAWLIWHYRVLIRDQTDYGLLAVAILLMASQAVLDSDYSDFMSLPFSRSAVEDPLKIMALLLLLIYAIRIFVALLGVHSPTSAADQAVERPENPARS